MGGASREPASDARDPTRPRVLVVRGHLASPAELGDWLGLARALAAGPLTRDPAFRASPDPERVWRPSAPAQAQRLASAYVELLGRPFERFERGLRAAAAQLEYDGAPVPV